MDGNTGTALVPSEYKPGDNALDAFRHELLLSRWSVQHHAYINVISRDSTLAFFSAGTPVDITNVSLSFGPCLLHTNLMLDNSIQSYLADLGDARTELEYFLVHHQVSLHGDTDLNASLVAAQAGLKLAPAGAPAALKRRRNAIYFLDTDGTGALNDKGIIAADVLHPFDGSEYAFLRGAVGGAGNSKNKDGMTVFVPLRKAEFERDTQTKHAFKHTLLNILQTMFPETHKPQVTTARSTTNLIEAPEFRYAGLALTDAHMHSSQGDTAVTVNHYSALTTQNGPYDVYIGDDLGWIFNIEKQCILPDGNRYPRVAITYGLLHQLVVHRADPAQRMAFRARVVTDAAAYNAACVLARGAVPPNAARLGQLKSGADSERSKYPRFVLVPLRHGSGIAKRSSVMDRQRRIGKAIGSCKGYGRLDWVNGASSEM